MVMFATPVPPLVIVAPEKSNMVACDTTKVPPLYTSTADDEPLVPELPEVPELPLVPFTPLLPDEPDVPLLPDVPS